jgi:hypothetical protein
MSTTIPSTSAPDKAWLLSFLKNPGRPGYWSGTEVTVTDRDPTGKPTGYTFEIFGDTRRVRGEPVPPPCTAKRQLAARESLLATMRAQGLITEGQS